MANRSGDDLLADVFLIYSLQLRRKGDWGLEGEVSFAFSQYLLISHLMCATSRGGHNDKKSRIENCWLALS